MTGDTLRLLSRGDNYELYEGRRCLFQLDWAGPVEQHSAHRATFVGFAESACGEAIIRLNELTKRPIVSFYDAWLCDGYENTLRSQMTAWSKRNPGRLTELHVLTQSPMVRMFLGVASLTLPGIVKGYAKKSEFEAVMARHGLPPVAPKPMPQSVPGR